MKDNILTVILQRIIRQEITTFFLTEKSTFLRLNDRITIKVTHVIFGATLHILINICCDLLI